MHFLNKVLLLLSCLIGFNAKSQVQKEFERLIVNEITSIDWKNFHYKDIIFFEEKLDDNKILILAEDNHGDGSSYEAQCMILKGLIDSSKINSLLIESSWINIERINSLLKAKGVNGIYEAAKYMRTVELRYWVDNGFWEYLARKIIENKIRLVGFDIDGISGLIIGDLFNEAIANSLPKEWIKENNAQFKLLQYEYKKFNGWNISSAYSFKNYERQRTFINVVIRDYELKKDFNKVNYWKSVLNFFYWMYKRSSVIKNNVFSNVIETEKQESLFMAIRDSLMAELFLQQYEKGTSSVALMSSYHALKSSDAIEGISCCKDSTVMTMSEILDRKLDERIYSVHFSSSSGYRGIRYYYGENQMTKIYNPADSSLESYLQYKKIDYGVIDLSTSSLNNAFFLMKAAFNRYLRSNWSLNFSAVFFIREMKPLLFKNPSVLKLVN